MRNLVLSIAASAALLTAAPLASAQVPSDGRLIYGVDAAGVPPMWRDVQFLFGGRNYCWYPNGWHGAGYYWCGYAYRRGLGWGGPVGWHGWRGGGHGGGDHGGFGGSGRHDAMAHGGPGGGHGGQPGGDHSGGGHAEGGHGGGGHAEGGHGGGGHGDGGHH
jgi:hypothetical protein